MQPLYSPDVGRVLRCSILLAAGLVVSACQSYRPAPLDLDQHRADLIARLDNEKPIRDFLAAREEHSSAAVAFDLDDGIGPAEAEVVALFYNPELRLARRRAGVALATAETAGLWEDPVFGFDGAELLSPTGPFEYGLTLSLTLPVSGRLGIEQLRDELAYDAERLRVAAAEWEVRIAVRRSWATWRAATDQLVLIDATLERIAGVRQLAGRLERAGELARAGARLLHAEHVTLRFERASVAATAERSRLALLEQMGLSPEAMVQFAGDEPIPMFAPHRDPDRLAEINPTIAVLMHEYAVAEQTLRLEVRKQYPDIEIGGGFGSEDDDERLLLGLSVPVPLLNANRRGIAEARAARELAREVVEAELERLRFELAGAVRRERSARARFDLLAAELEPILDEQAAELERLAELGEIDTLLMLETVTRRLDAKRQLLDLRLSEQLAAIDAAELIGPVSTPNTTTNRDEQDAGGTLP